MGQASESPYTSATRYDATRRVTGTIAPDPDGTGPLHYAAVRTTYDPAGRLIGVETGGLAAWQSEAVAPASWSGFTVHRTLETAYDVMGRKTRTRDNDAYYTGQAWLPELGMQHYKARIYSPTLGRFLQTDPVGYDGGINLYAHVANDPVNQMDPDGQQPDSVMDRRNEAFLQVVTGCEGLACAIALAERVFVAVDAGLIALDVLNIPSGEGVAAVAAQRELTQRVTQQIRPIVHGRFPRAGPGDAMRLLREARTLARSADTNGST